MHKHPIGTIEGLHIESDRTCSVQPKGVEGLREGGHAAGRDKETQERQSKRLADCLQARCSSYKRLAY